jgi:cytochrome c551/c552
MTKSQIWIAVFIGIFIVLFLINQATEEEKISIAESQIGQNKNQNSEIVKLLEDQNCLACHGQNLEGTSMAPSLQNLKEYWKNEEDLIAYLENPDKFMKEERFIDYKKKYKTIMPPYNNLSKDKLKQIVNYLLSK